MSGERKENSEGFLDRWSRLKKDAAQPAQEADLRAPVKIDAGEPPPELPPIEKLTLDSDFSGFFHPKVDEDMRRAALRKLFTDPHFNVMDGLDIYIDDYSKSEPIPAAMLASMKQAQRILDWAANKEDTASPDGPEADSNGEVAGTPADPPAALEALESDPRIQAVVQPEAVPAQKT